ncbi:MAG TPA: hypothetical protein VFV20_05415, partial [Candidatus Limnocylindria bacterium]|nr:hypothetical protein [Candidatus Limnocylindria bacterium]
GALRVLAARVASAADLATLAAVDDQDEMVLVRDGTLRLASDATEITRRFFALELEQIAAHLERSPGAVAAEADVAAFATGLAFDPITGMRYDRPTIRLDAAVGVRTPAFGALLLPVITTVHVRSVSSPR